MGDDVMERIAAALERVAVSYEAQANNSRLLVEKSKGADEASAAWKERYDQVYQQNMVLRQELETVRMAALHMRQHLEKKYRDCHDGSEQACSKPHTGEE